MTRALSSRLRVAGSQLDRSLDRREPEGLSRRSRPPGPGCLRLGDRDGAVVERVSQTVIPWVDRERTTARVLTMELIEGTPPAPAAELRAAGLDPDRLLVIGAEAMVEQLFGVCFLGFGIGRLRPRERRRAGYMVWALASGDFDAVADQLLAFAQLVPDSRPNEFREALEEVVEDWYAGAEAGGSVAQLLLRELALGR